MLLEFSDSESEFQGKCIPKTDLDAKSCQPNQAKFNIAERKETIERYFWFVNVEGMSHVDGTSVRTFVTVNNSQNIFSKLSHATVSRWLKAYKRGEYENWAGLKGMTADCITNRNLAVVCIDKFLKKRDKHHGVYNRVAVSPSVPTEYGVIARRYTPSGTFLGYYKGAVLRGQQEDVRNHDFTFAIGRNQYIDASDFHSCFARYYNCALNLADQNVCVEHLQDWKNPQKAICFIANRDIQKGEEFLVSYGADYWEALGQNLPRRCHLQYVCRRLSNKALYAREAVDPLYSVDAPRLSKEFLDDASESEGDNSDSDYSP
jgi:hypothetical protein